MQVCHCFCLVVIKGHVNQSPVVWLDTFAEYPPGCPVFPSELVGLYKGCCMPCSETCDDWERILWKWSHHLPLGVVVRSQVDGSHLRISGHCPLMAHSKAHRNHVQCIMSLRLEHSDACKICPCFRFGCHSRCLRNVVHAVRTACEVLCVGNYPNPSFGPFPQGTPPPLKSLPPPGGGWNRHLGPESIGNTRRQRRQRKFLQGAKADLHCDTMVQFCGAGPGLVPTPPGGEPSLCNRPPPRGGGNRPDKRGEGT